MADYVDLRYVLYCIEEHKKVADGCSEFTRELSELIHNQIIDLMKLTPAADVVPVVHGRWTKVDDGIYYYMECSLCHERPLRNRWVEDYELSRYCPNCGARMDGDGE